MKHSRDGCQAVPRMALEEHQGLQVGIQTREIIPLFGSEAYLAGNCLGTWLM